MSIKIKVVARVAALLTLSFGLSSIGCGSPGGTNVQPDSGTFIAVASDMTGFHSWPSFDGGNDVVDQVHSNGYRRLYINSLPTHGSTQFAVGTIIIKEVPMGDDGGVPELFGMAKRGGDYNDAGAVNWEWFALLDAGPGDNVQIIWRGDGPPQGSTYGATHEACNECHALSISNDFVAAPAMQLTNF